MKSVLAFSVAVALWLPASEVMAQATNTNGSTAYSPNTPNFVAVPGVPTMYINGGGPGAAGAAAVKFIHDWGKYGMEAAHDCDRKNATLAVTTLMGYEGSLSAAYDTASAAGQDGSALLNDAAVIATVVNYIRQALAACAPPENAMLTPSPPPDEAYARAPEDHHHSGGLFDNVTIGIGVGVGGGGHDDHGHHDDRGNSDNRDR